MLKFLKSLLKPTPVNQPVNNVPNWKSVPVQNLKPGDITDFGKILTIQDFTKNNKKARSRTVLVHYEDSRPRQVYAGYNKVAEELVTQTLTVGRNAAMRVATPDTAHLTKYTENKKYIQESYGSSNQ